MQAYAGHALAQGLGETQVEAGVVDEEGTIDGLVLGGGQDGIKEAVQPGQVLDDLNEAHDGQVLHPRQLAIQVGRHAGSPHADDPQVRVPLLEAAQELGAVQVARVLARDHQ